MTNGEQAIWLGLLVVGMAGMALAYGMETGLYCLNRVKLEVRAAKGPRAGAAKLLRREMKRPEDLLATSLVCIIAFGDLAAIAASRLLAGLGYSDGAVLAINAAVLTPVFFVFLESIPKEVFRLEADRLTYRFVRALVTVRVMLTVIPILPLMRWVAGIVSGLLGGRDDAELALSAPERVAALIKDSAGAVSESQAGLFDRALAFERMTAADVMTPWAEVRLMPADWTRDQAVRLLSSGGPALTPVVERGASGRVVGVLRFEDAFLRAEGTAAALSRRPASIPARMTLVEVAMRLRASEAEAGLVEESGRVVGLVSLADVLEPLAGPAA